MSRTDWIVAAVVGGLVLSFLILTVPLLLAPIPEPKHRARS